MGLKSLADTHASRPRREVCALPDRLFLERSEQRASRMGRCWTMTEPQQPDLRAALTSLVSTVLMNPETAMTSFAGWCQDHGVEPEATYVDGRSPL
jgi:hypothetical protein